MSFIPEKIYVARQHRKDDEVVGYMVIADKENTKTVQNQKDKADRWAKQYSHLYTQLEPIYIDNVPKTGFKLVTNVSRYSTSNVVWRILHPVGNFEFEISSDNMCDLLATNTIVQGEFQEELFFTSSRKLVSTKTKLFADMIQQEEKKNEEKEIQKTLEVGSTIQLNIPKYCEPNKLHTLELIFLGKYHTCNVIKDKGLATTSKSTLRYVLQNPKTKDIHVLTKLTNFEVLDKELVEIDKSTILDEINNSIIKSNKIIRRYYQPDYIPNEISPIFCSEKPYNFSDLKVQTKKVPLNSIDEFAFNKAYYINNYRVFGFGFDHNSYSSCTSAFQGRWYLEYYNKEGSKDYKLTSLYGKRTFLVDGFPKSDENPDNISVKYFRRLDLVDELEVYYYTL